MGCCDRYLVDGRLDQPRVVSYIRYPAFLGGSGYLGAVCLYWQYGLYRAHTRKVLFLLEALENDDASVHFVETEANRDNRLVSQALNKVAQILYKVKNETAQQEKYYELILECVNTGILVLNDNGAVYQKNSEALRLLGMEVFTHVLQLECVDHHLMEVVTACRSGDKLQAVFSNERGTVNLSIRVSDIHVHKEHLRILALNDINNELDEKEGDSHHFAQRYLADADERGRCF